MPVSANTTSDYPTNSIYDEINMQEEVYDDINEEKIGYSSLDIPVPISEQPSNDNYQTLTSAAGVPKEKEDANQSTSETDHKYLWLIDDECVSEM